MDSSILDSQSLIANLIADTTQHAKVSHEAGPCGCFVVLKSCLQAPLSGLVCARYHFRVRSGHHNLSEGTEEEDPISGTKISGGVNVAVWFFVKRTP